MWNHSLLIKNIINVKTSCICYFRKNFSEYVSLYKPHAIKMIATVVNPNFTDKSLLSWSAAFMIRQLTQFSFHFLVCVFLSLSLYFSPQLFFKNKIQRLVLHLFLCWFSAAGSSISPASFLSVHKSMKKWWTEKIFVAYAAKKFLVIKRKIIF